MKTLYREFRLCITTAETAAAKASGYAHTPIVLSERTLL